MNLLDNLNNHDILTKEFKCLLNILVNNGFGVLSFLIVIKDQFFLEAEICSILKFCAMARNIL
jgi:hypothetical protein